MPMFKPLQLPKVSFFGDHEAEPVQQIKAQGKCFLVSSDPDTYMEAHRPNGPEVELTFPPAQWLNVDDLSFEDWEELRDWALMRGYIQRIKVWFGMVENPDTGDMEEKVFYDLEEGVGHAGRSLTQEEAAREMGQGAFTQEERLRLTRSAIRRLPNWPDPLQWHAAVPLLYGHDVMLPKRPYVVGVWYETGFDSVEIPKKTGLLFPERIGEFDAEVFE